MGKRTKIGKNELCPCGSGKTYERCQDGTQHFSGRQLTAKDMPRVHDTLDCVFPLLTRWDGAPEYPGVHGTAFALSYHGKTVFLATKHQGDSISSIGLPDSANTITFIEVETFTVDTSGEVSDDLDRFDIAVMVPKKPIDFMDVAPHVFVGWVRPGMVSAKALFALAGCPRSGVDVDYERWTVSTETWYGLGRLVGPLGSAEACHTLEFDQDLPGGGQGLSGSPVFRAFYDDQAGWIPQFAGITIRGGGRVIHFIEGAVVRKVLAALVA